MPNCKSPLKTALVLTEAEPPTYNREKIRRKARDFSQLDFNTTTKMLYLGVFIKARALQSFQMFSKEKFL